MYEPKFTYDPSMLLTPQESNWNSRIIDEGLWSTFWGNARLAVRLDTTIGTLTNLLEDHAITFNNEDEFAPINRPLTAKDWRNGPYYRQGMRYRKGLTQAQAMDLAESWDTVHYQQYLNRVSDGLGTNVVEFLGRIAGNLIDPLNIIPIGGTLYRVGRVAKLGTTALRQPLIRGAIEGAGGMLLAEPFVRSNYETFNEARTWQDTVFDVTLGTAFGAAVGGIIGKFGKVKPIKQISGEVSAREQVNATKAFAQAVDQVANGDVATVGDSGISAVNSIANRIVRNTEGTPDSAKMPGNEPIDIATEKGVEEPFESVIPPVKEEVTIESDQFGKTEYELKLEGVNKEQNTFIGEEQFDELLTRVGDEEDVADLDALAREQKEAEVLKENKELLIRCIMGEL